jgi:NAD(P)-dependent dehydrogenase (short-subunit alcohol dehydrogenase family)
VDDKRVCIFTGAGGRLGSDFCTRYCYDYNIVAVCRRRLPGVSDQDRTFFDPLKGVIEDGSAAVFTISMDLEEDQAAKRIVELTLARYGRIDLIVNAAAHIEHERLTVSAEVSAHLDRSFYLNATFPVILASTAARDFWDGRRAENLTANRNVINISSGAGLGYAYSPGLGAYSASKAAVNFLTCYLAEEFHGFGIRVNGIAPTTFPDIIPVQLVSDQIAQLDKDSATGTIIDLS